MVDHEQLSTLMYDHAPNPTLLVRVEPEDGYRCASANRAYLSWLGLSEKAVIGKPLAQVCPEPETALTKYRQVVATRQPAQFERDNVNAAVFQTTLTPIVNEAGQCDYVLEVAQDITALKRVEQAEHDRRVFAEHLRRVATLVNSTLDLDQVLEQTLINVGHVVPHDAANIMLLDTNGVYTIARGRGYERYGGLGALWNLALRTQNAHLTMMETKQPLALTHTSPPEDAETACVPATIGMRSYAGAPLCVRNRIIGFLNLESAVPGCFSPAHAERLQMFADLIAVAVENARLHMQIRELSIVDDLTGVYNRRGLFQFGEYELARAERYGRPLCAIMLDIDRFKRANDTYGHLAGDALLRDLAHRCRENIRAMDILARYGGEEFVMILPETDAATGQVVAERLRRTIADAPFQVRLPERDCTVNLTVSLGVTQMRAPRALTELIGETDHAVYVAKNAGGNLVVVR